MFDRALSVNPAVPPVIGGTLSWVNSQCGQYAEEVKAALKRQYPNLGDVSLSGINERDAEDGQATGSRSGVVWFDMGDEVLKAFPTQGRPRIDIRLAEECLLNHADAQIMGGRNPFLQRAGDVCSGRNFCSTHVPAVGEEFEGPGNGVPELEGVHCRLGACSEELGRGLPIAHSPLQCFHRIFGTAG